MTCEDYPRTVALGYDMPSSEGRLSVVGRNARGRFMECENIVAFGALKYARKARKHDQDGYAPQQEL
jgi:hypothetical protein